ncbi:hypothetical protein DYBT9275_04550 [Dyadobacter sp. CECT 9275]|uniref:Tetratricopeptide repeat protein n=1 Tax=Dyadobacter helix TaxID=2822344 RepID=A0A916N6F8_9BACT|nr:tetratricopeptide repeat protein [Dyadobacter sp. CECT 9275]CAG5009688.1 hypothetical protein DYBT9275_04550 [Dyadobacter sp. CECT 9275]
MDERIERYFGQEISAEEKEKFEADLKSDPILADDVAFYLASKQAAQHVREIKLAQRHAEWSSQKQPDDARFVSLRTWYAVAAAVAFIAFGLAWYRLAPRSQDLQQLANGYTMENFTTLGVQMGSAEDSLQLAIHNYNRGQYATATAICEGILRKDPQHAEAKRVAGIIALKLLEYDKAIDYFHQLGEQQGLYANPGKFYEAIALLKRGAAGDREKAKDLLHQVIEGNLEGKEEAVKWMD